MEGCGAERGGGSRPGSLLGNCVSGPLDDGGGGGAALLPRSSFSS